MDDVRRATNVALTLFFNLPEVDHELKCERCMNTFLRPHLRQTDRDLLTTFSPVDKHKINVGVWFGVQQLQLQRLIQSSAYRLNVLCLQVERLCITMSNN